MDTHFENACGVTPQTLANSHWDRGVSARKSIKDFIPPIVNPNLTFVNWKLIPPTVGKSYNQPMVNTFIENLLRLKYEHRESWAKIGEHAGVSAQAAHKWSKGGNISEEQLNKLAAHYGITPSQLKYGEDHLDATESELLELFRAADMRGRRYILRAAQEETRVPIPESPPEGITRTVKAGKTGKNIMGYTGVERRGKKTEDEWPKK